MAINRYVYITVNPKFDHRTRVSYSRTEEADTVDQIQHPIVRESMKMLSLNGGIEITSIADVPSRGSGLGSSSSFTVGLLHALHAFSGRYASANRLAREACEIEIERCGEPIGKQDQYAAAYGGFNFIQFHSDDSVSVDPIVCRTETLLRLRERILVFYTGICRKASNILNGQQAAMAAKKGNQRIAQEMVQLAYQLRTELHKDNLDAFGNILHANWELKRRLSNAISSRQIDSWYTAARKQGALGGKILGAGGGGFLMFYAPQECHEAIARSLEGLRRVDIGFDHRGSSIIFVHD
jgi:D-glycero-alpha-D-manno-heptose-7-phosphate kinase